MWAQVNDAAQPKLDIMMGLFHDGGQSSVLVGNVAAGSERAGFSGPGTGCNITAQTLRNEAHSSLVGYWFNYYAMINQDCAGLAAFTGWRLYLYGVYGELPKVQTAELTGVAVADTTVGIKIAMVGTPALDHERLDKRVVIRDSLIVGSTTGGAGPDGGAGGCGVGKIPSLFTCAYPFAYCSDVGQVHCPVYILTQLPLVCFDGFWQEGSCRSSLMVKAILL